MKSDLIIVASNGSGLKEALLQTDKVAEQCHLSPKDTLHLRLLVEETLNMMRSINSEHSSWFYLSVLFFPSRWLPRIVKRMASSLFIKAHQIFTMRFAHYHQVWQFRRSNMKSKMGNYGT